MSHRPLRRLLVSLLVLAGLAPGLDAAEQGSDRGRAGGAGLAPVQAAQAPQAPQAAQATQAPQGARPAQGTPEMLGAQPASPAPGARCDTALAALQAREQALLEARRAAPADPRSASPAPSPAVQDALLQRLRRTAATDCLGVAAGLDTAPPRTRVQPPVSVAPAAAGRAPSGALSGSPGPLPSSPPTRPTAPQAAPVFPLPPVALPGRPAANRPPAAIAACDATGCWSTDGQRLPRNGPVLLGPRGVCTVQGALLSCP